MEIAALIVAVIAAVIAIWQGYTSKQQLDQAKETKSDTQRALDEIRELSRDNKRLAESIKSEIDTRITRMIDIQLKDQEESNAMSTELATGFMKGLGGMFMTAMEQGATPQSGSEETPTAS